MKKFILAMCVSMAVVMMFGPAYAMEAGPVHGPGGDEGLAAGALPPQGFYFINDFVMLPSLITHGPIFDYNFNGGPVPTHVGPVKNGEGISNEKLIAVVDAPILLWVPGCKFLGADYGVAIAEPFDYTNLNVQVGGHPFGGQPFGGVLGDTNTFVGGAQMGASNTVLVPYILSWKLPCDWRIKTAFSVVVPDATTSTGNRIRSTDAVTGQAFSNRANQDGGIYAESGQDFWSFTPEIGISYLHAGWNFSADFFFSFSTKNNDTNYQSGDIFAADYTITYTCGKWTFGLGAYEQNQLNSDSFVQPFGATGAYGLPGDGLYHSQPGTKLTAYGIGPILGYNFGPCSLMFVYNVPLDSDNLANGESILVRLVVPLGKLGM